MPRKKETAKAVMTGSAHGAVIGGEEPCLGSQCYRLATDAVERLNKDGPRPARFAVGLLQRVGLKGASLFGLQTIQQVDEWMIVQMRAADLLIWRAEKAIMSIYHSPTPSQQLWHKVPRWLPFSGPIRAQQLSQRAQHPQTLSVHKDSSKHRVCRAAPPPSAAGLHKKELEQTASSTNPLQQPASFSRRALATTLPSALPLRTFDDAAWEHLQYSPKSNKSAAVFSRREQASAVSLRTFDEDTLARLVHQEDTYLQGGVMGDEKERTRSARTASAASTEHHSSPPLDAFAAFNPSVPAWELINSVGNLFDANPAPEARYRDTPVIGHESSTFTC